MAEESFENQRIAELLNDSFISIKVDREEFPEVDTYYQKACNLFTGGGGWPLSGFLTPEGDPIFVGTYFPAQTSEQNIPTFPQLINEISGAYKNDQEGVNKSAKEATEQITKGPQKPEDVKFEGHFPHPSIVLNAIKQFEDESHGGYGDAPKFPQFSFYEWGIEHLSQGNIPADQGKHLVTTIEKMLCGGIYDQARGGIHRYSVDPAWAVPHFEKMLYDQAGLLKLLSKFSVIHPSPLVFDAIFNTLVYLEKEMLGTDNYFLSSQDADSEGQEGLYFTFTKEEFEEIVSGDNSELTDEQLEKVNQWFPITKDGNFEMALNTVTLSHSNLAEMFTEENWDIVRKTKQALLKARSVRIPPRTDQKGIAGWNFLLATGICDVIQYAGAAQIKHYASTVLRKTLEPMLKTFTVVDEGKTKLIHSTTQKEKSDLFEDYVYFAELMLRSYEVSGNMVFKQNLKNVLTMIAAEFYEDGGFKNVKKNANSPTPNLHADLFDQSYASPVGVLIKVTRRARVLFSDQNILSEIDDQFLKNATNSVLQNPIYHGESLGALTYPDQIYQRLTVPRTWLSNEKFLQFSGKLMSKIILDYHDEDSWSLCNLEACLAEGKTFEDMESKLSSTGPTAK